MSLTPSVSQLHGAGRATEAGEVARQARELPVVPVPLLLRDGLVLHAIEQIIQPGLVIHFIGENPVPATGLDTGFTAQGIDF